jgi:hypothetical protein
VLHAASRREPRSTAAVMGDRQRWATLRGPRGGDTTKYRESTGDYQKAYTCHASGRLYIAWGQQSFSHDEAA